MQRIAGLLCALALLGAASVRAQQPGQEEVYRLANQVRKRIVTLDNYGVFDWITFGIARGTAGYRVVLRGYASRPTLKTSAERVVMQIEGVESVQNEIEVAPNSGNDEDIRLGAYARIYGHPMLSRYNPNRGTPVYGFERRAFMGISNDPPRGPHPFHILVKNGNITLEGVVDTEGDKTMLTMQANSVSGAFSVTNNVQALQAPKTKPKKEAAHP